MSYGIGGGSVDILNDPRSATRDTAGRVRTSEVRTRFESKQVWNADPLRWNDLQVSGAGTATLYNVNRSSSIISVANLTAGKRVRQSKIYTQYQAGKCHLAEPTAIMGPALQGITKRMGYFDERNGLFVERTLSGDRFGLRSSTSGAPVDTLFQQSAWNVDKLNGNGQSKILLDLNKNQIFHVDFEWYSAGNVRYGFNIGGRLVYAHIAEFANLSDVAYMTSPNLPIRYEIENDGTGPAASMECICSSVNSEAGRDYTGFPFAADRDVLALSVPAAGAYYPLLAIRINPATPGPLVKPTYYSLSCDQTADYNVRLLLNPNFVGVAPVWQNKTNSFVQFAVPTNATTVTGGTQCGTGQGRQTAGGTTVPVAISAPDLQLGVGVNGAEGDVFVLAVALSAGVTIPFLGGLGWEESI